MTYNLKPCPICGGKAELCGYGTARSVFNENGEEHIFFDDFYGYRVECEDCTKTSKLYFQEERAVEEWNRFEEVQHDTH